MTLKNSPINDETFHLYSTANNKKRIGYFGKFTKKCREFSVKFLNTYNMQMSFHVEKLKRFPQILK